MLEHSQGKKHESITKTVKKLNRKLSTKLNDEEVHYIAKLKSNDGKEKIKIVFSNQRSRDEVYKNRTKLKGNDIWITEDLTISRSNLAYMARQAVKREHAHSTWSQNGWIYVKKTENCKPRRIINQDDLMNYLEIVPLIREDANDSDDASVGNARK